MSMTISKSNYVAGVQCLKRLYLQVNEPDVAAQSDAADYAIMEQGREVGNSYVVKRIDSDFFEDEIVPEAASEPESK
jgi:hypothetical protein